MNKSAMRSIFLFVIISFSLSGHILSQDAVRVAEPPIVKIELSGVEPLPDGVAKLMGFGTGAGGGGAEFEINNVPTWEFAPSIVYPQIPPKPMNGVYFGSTFAACGYPEEDYAEVVVTSPSGKSEVVEIVGSGDCWEYFQVWSYGMELGEYNLVAEHPNGTLTHSWLVEYPPFQVIEILSNPSKDEGIQTRLLMGFEPEEQLTLRIYSPEIEVELTEEADLKIPGAGDATRGGYVASRIVEADENGAVIIEFSGTPSSPFDVRMIGFTIDGYQNPIGSVLNPAFDEYQVEKISTADQSDIPYSVYQPNITYIDQINTPTIWKGLKFNDMKAPGTHNYQASLTDSEYLLRFIWCADSASRLKEILAPFELTILVDHEVVSPWYILQYDEDECRTWVSVLDPNTSELRIEFHYTLSEDIFDGTANYKAGDYFHIIDATFQ